jgi:5-methylcytosine-specific restriction endonuclease McrA
VAEVIERDGGMCWLCGKPGADSADHVLPASRGGRDALANLRAAHHRCNLARRGADAPSGQPIPRQKGGRARLP